MPRPRRTWDLLVLVYFLSKAAPRNTPLMCPPPPPMVLLGFKKWESTRCKFFFGISGTHRSQFLCCLEVLGSNLRYFFSTTNGLTFSSTEKDFLVIEHCSVSQQTAGLPEHCLIFKICVLWSHLEFLRHVMLFWQM